MTPNKRVHEYTSKWLWMFRSFSSSPKSERNMLKHRRHSSWDHVGNNDLHQGHTRITAEGSTQGHRRHNSCDTAESGCSSFSLWRKRQLHFPDMEGRKEETHQRVESAATPTASSRTTGHAQYVGREILGDSSYFSDISESADDSSIEHDDFESRHIITHDTPIPWVIHVLDVGNEYTNNSSISFRIFFRRENEYVYYSSTEIIDYVKDLVELDCSFMFSLTFMSSGKSETINGRAILEILSLIVDSHMNGNSEGP